MPEVVADPQGEVAKTFQNLGVCVVQQCAKIRQQGTISMLHRLWSVEKLGMVFFPQKFRTFLLSCCLPIGLLNNMVLPSDDENYLFSFSINSCDL